MGFGKGLNMEQNYIDRIKKLKSEKKITNERLSEMTEIPLGTLSKILAGMSDSPKLSNVMAICTALGTSLDYVVFGIEKNDNNCTLDTVEMRMLGKYRCLDTHGKELVSVVMDKELERIETYRLESAENNERVSAVYTTEEIQRRIAAQKSKSGLGKRTIPLYNLAVSAGTGVYLDDTQAAEISIPNNSRTFDADYALRISGNSMEPKYHNGDILLVQECDSVEVGELGIFVLDGDGYFKLFGGDRLISLNDDYGDILLKDFTDVHCTGRVIGKLRRR